jgi:hypothetical protein
MMRKLYLLLAVLAVVLVPGMARATCPSFPYIFTNGVTIDANQLMANLNLLLTCAQESLPAGTLAITQGGTGATTATGALANLGAVPAHVVNSADTTGGSTLATAAPLTADVATHNITGTPLGSVQLQSCATAPSPQRIVDGAGGPIFVYPQPSETIAFPGIAGGSPGQPVEITGNADFGCSNSTTPMLLGAQSGALALPPLVLTGQSPSLSAGQGYSWYSLFPTTLSPWIGNASWAWGPSSSTIPDQTVGTQVWQAFYVTTDRWENNLDNSRTVTWWLANDPSALEYSWPIVFSGTLSGNTISALTINGNAYDPTAATVNPVTGLGCQAYTPCHLALQYTNTGVTFVTGLAGCSGVTVTGTTTTTITLSTSSCTAGSITGTIYMPAYLFVPTDNASSVPIDISDPAVQNLYLYACKQVSSPTTPCSITSVIANGYRGISLDNVEASNSAYRYGAFKGTTAGTCLSANQPFCGGVFTPNALGQEYRDVPFIKSEINWVKKIRSAVNSIGGLLVGNIGDSAEITTVGFGSFDYDQALVNSVDVWLTEEILYSASGCAAPPYYAHTGPAWLYRARLVQSTNAAYAPTDDENCFTTVASPQSSANMAGEEWSIATLLSYCHTANCYYNEINPIDGKTWVQPESSWLVAENCGSPTLAPPLYQNSGGAWERDYPNCIVATNQNLTGTSTVSLPSNHTWQDIFGNSKSGTITLNAPVNGALGTSIVAIRTN